MPDVMADLFSRGSATLVGLFILVATTVSLLRTVVIPRSLRSIISDAVSRAVIAVAMGLSHLRPDYRRRDGVLAWVGPMIILAQLITWLILFLVGFGLLIFGLRGDQTLGEALRQSGSSLFTLGFAAANQSDATILDFMAAAAGPIIIALMIGFLPTIYGAYVERESEVISLNATSGEPAWGPELLARFTMADSLDACQPLFMRWAAWATRLRLTHTIYPVLVWVRSPRATRHYVVSLLAVMDAAALRMSLSSRPGHPEAFAVLLQGGQAINAIYTTLFQKSLWGGRGYLGTFDAERTTLRRELPTLPRWDRRFLALQVASDRDSLQGLDADAVDALAKGDGTVLLTRDDFDHAVDMLRTAGYPIEVDLDQAWNEFRVARGRYEFAAYAICRRLDAVPAPWSGERRVPTPTLWPTLAVETLPDLEPDGDA